MFVDFLNEYIGPSDCVLLWNVEQLFIFEDIVQSLLNKCLYNVCSLLLTKPCSNQI